MLDLVRFDPLGGCDVVLPPWPGLDRAARALGALGARVHRLAPAPRRDGVTAWLARRPVDLVHVHFATEADGTAAVEAALAHGIRAVSTDHACASGDAATDGWRARRRAAARMSAVLADSHAVAAALAARLGRPVRVLAHGIDAAAFAGGPPRALARRIFGIPPWARVVGSIGALFSHKGMHRLVEAAAALGPDVVVLIAGEGPERPRLAHLAHERGVDLRLPGWLEDVRPALAAMDVFALASDSEGLPSAVLQAMAARVPVVATAAGGTSEALGTCGRLVPGGDSAALVRALAAALEHRGLDAAEQRLHAARRRVETRFEVRRLAREVDAVHRAALAAPPQTGGVPPAVTRRRSARPGREAARGSS